MFTAYTGSLENITYSKLWCESSLFCDSSLRNLECNLDVHTEFYSRQQRQNKVDGWEECSHVNMGLKKTERRHLRRLLNHHALRGFPIGLGTARPKKNCTSTKSFRSIPSEGIYELSQPGSFKAVWQRLGMPSILRCQLVDMARAGLSTSVFRRCWLVNNFVVCRVAWRCGIQASTSQASCEAAYQAVAAALAQDLV